MPLQGILNTARSMSFYMRLQEVTANNLANAGTDAFKAERLAAHILPGATSAVPVSATDLEQGRFRETGRPLDVSLDGPGFFVVRTPQGDRLTRGGSLRLDGAGRLTDAHGDPLLDAEGPLVMQGGQIEVQADGAVLVDGTLAGHLKIVNVPEPHTLLKEGFGRFVPSGELEPVEPGATRVRQGAVEEANVDPLLSMVDLVTIQRAYAANVDALKAMDSVLGAITNEVGKV